MADLFQRNKSTISRHIGNIYKEGELDKAATVAKFATVQQEGDRKVERQIEYYNLDVIISVGYRVKSHRGVQFRLWAAGILKEYMKKGFVLDDERLKNLGGGNYFDELLARIRDIRSSEKVFWRKVLEIYATSIDYDPKAESTVLFFKQVQNKMHWAAHQHTAAEVIYQRADAEKEHMGLTSWQGEQIHRTDVEVAKNYLSQKELDALNKELAEKNGALIGVNSFTLDGNEAEISEAKDVLAKKGATYQNVYFDSDGEAGKFTTNIFAYPTTYVVDRSGNIVGEPIVGAITEKKQAETLQKLIEQALAADVG